MTKSTSEMRFVAIDAVAATMSTSRVVEYSCPKADGVSIEDCAACVSVSTGGKGNSAGRFLGLLTGEVTGVSKTTPSPSEPREAHMIVGRLVRGRAPWRAATGFFFLPFLHLHFYLHSTSNLPLNL